MTTAAIAKRLAEIERMAAKLRPPAPLPEQLAWIRFVSGNELDQLEALYAAAEADRRELSEDDARTVLSIEARALGRMLADWPECSAEPERYRLADCTAVAARGRCKSGENPDQPRQTDS